jgi:hypothetical protein
LDDSKPPQPRGRSDSLRAAIDRTLSSLGDARAASATDVPGEVVERAGELLDEVARRGRDARTEIVRRGTGAGAELARRGDEARAEVARRGQEAASASAALGARVLEAVGETLRRRSKPKVEDE